MPCGAELRSEGHGTPGPRTGRARRPAAPRGRARTARDCSCPPAGEPRALPTLVPIWFPHWPAWMCTISLMAGAGSALGDWLFRQRRRLGPRGALWGTRTSARPPPYPGRPDQLWRAAPLRPRPAVLPPAPTSRSPHPLPHGRSLRLRGTRASLHSWPPRPPFPPAPPPPVPRSAHLPLGRLNPFLPQKRAQTGDSLGDLPARGATPGNEPVSAAERGRAGRD